MLQYSFDRIVRTGSAAFRAFTQNSIDLFRREKPERVAARRTGPTICHGTKHRVEFGRRTGCFGECPTLSTTDVFRKRASRGGMVPGSSLNLFWATPLQSPALDRSPYPFGKAASAEGQILPRRDVGAVKYLLVVGTSSSKKQKSGKASGITRALRLHHLRWSSSERAVWQVLRPWDLPIQPFAS